uniref:Uncharacterized protein n=1 Tax=Acrobeloides nanus TaxID=290746 RepID=A0A914EJL6_9BILA
MRTSFGPDTAEFWGAFLVPVVSTLTTILTLLFGLIAVIKLRYMKKEMKQIAHVNKVSNNDIRLLSMS